MNALNVVNWLAFLFVTAYGLYLFAYVVKTRYEYIKLGKKVEFDDKTNTVQIIFPKGMAKMDEINQFCFNNGIVLTQLVLRKKRLEARFFELTNN